MRNLVYTILKKTFIVNYLTKWKHLVNSLRSGCRPYNWINNSFISVDIFSLNLLTPSVFLYSLISVIQLNNSSPWKSLRKRWFTPFQNPSKVGNIWKKILASRMYFKNDFEQKKKFSFPYFFQIWDGSNRPKNLALT